MAKSYSEYVAERDEMRDRIVGVCVDHNFSSLGEETQRTFRELLKVTFDAGVNYPAYSNGGNPDR